MESFLKGAAQRALVRKNYEAETKAKAVDSFSCPKCFSEIPQGMNKWKRERKREIVSACVCVRERERGKSYPCSYRQLITICVFFLFTQRV